MGKVDKLHSTTRNVPPQHDNFGETDRRIRGDRLLVQFPVYATYRGNLIQGFVQAMNLSWSGMLLATNFPLSLGDRISLEFTLPTNDIPVSVIARVVHKTPETRPDEATRIGVAFEEMDPNIQRMISGFVLEHLST